MVKPDRGVLLLNFGAPGSLDEVEAFVTHILGPRKFSAQVLGKIKERYRAIGGGSPLLAITRGQAEQLRQELHREGKDWLVYLGTLHGRPSIPETVGEMAGNGVKRIFALSLAPFYSRASTGAYYRAVEEVAARVGNIRVEYAPPWHQHELFIEAMTEKIRAGLISFPFPDQTCLIFSTHSIPLDDGEDARVYRQQFEDTMGLMIHRLQHRRYCPAYQSKGDKPGRWLGPQVEEVIKGLARQGEKDVLVAPLGFVSDNMETLHDLDIDLKTRAEHQGINFFRVPALNEDPLFIKALADVISQHWATEWCG